MREERLPIAVTLFAFVLRLGAFFALGRHLKPETWESNEIALNMIHKGQHLMHWNNTDCSSFCYPVYPAITAAIHFLTKENYFILGLCHIALSAAICYIIYKIAEKVFDQRIALIASLLVAVHPGLIVYATKLHELTLVAFMMVFIFLYMLNSDCSRVSRAIGMGLLIGIGILTRPTFLLFLPVYGFYIWRTLKDARRSLLFFGVAAVVTVLVIMPWTLRNYAIHKRWIFITTSSAEHFWRGNNPNASGSSLTAGGKTMMEVDITGFQDRLYKMNEMQQYDFFRSEAMKFIKGNPLQFIKLTLKKYFYFWYFSPQAGLTYPKYWLLAYKIYYAFCALFFVWGAYAVFSAGSQRMKVFTIAVLFLFALIAALHSIYYIEMRHRWAVEPLMLILTAHGISVFFYSLKGHIHAR